SRTCTHIYIPSLHDALPIWGEFVRKIEKLMDYTNKTIVISGGGSGIGWAISQTFALAGGRVYVLEVNDETATQVIKEADLESRIDRKSTRLNSSHVKISYAV